MRRAKASYPAHGAMPEGPADQKPRQTAISRNFLKTIAAGGRVAAVVSGVAAGIVLATTPAFAQDSQQPAAPALQSEAPPAAGPADALQPEPAAPPRHGFFQRFIDEEDKGLDFSNFLAKGGFIPIPVIITEPAVDNGFGLAAAFIKPDPANPRHVTKTVVGGFKTGNGSDGVGFFRGGYAFDGRLNYRVGIGHGKVTLDSFPAFAPEGIEYTSKYAYGIVGSALWHFADDRFSVGPLFDFRKLKTQIDGLPVPEQFDDDVGSTLHTGAIGLGVHFDSRDNPLTPRQGTNALVEAKFNRGAFGSDRDYEVYNGYLFNFDRLGPNLRYGAKLEVDAVRGDFPFFYAPAINLRGVQAAQYQGMNVVSAEAELTWQLSRRWSVLAFGGVGATDAGSRRIFHDSGAIAAGGVGFRYLLARKVGFDAGMDFAYGPGGFVFYLQFGHAWSFKMD